MVHAFSMGETHKFSTGVKKAMIKETVEKEGDICKNLALLSPASKKELQNLVKTAGTYYMVNMGKKWKKGRMEEGGYYTERKENQDNRRWSDR